MMNQVRQPALPPELATAKCLKRHLHHVISKLILPVLLVVLASACFYQHGHLRHSMKNIEEAEKIMIEGLDGNTVKNLYIVNSSKLHLFYKQLVAAAQSLVLIHNLNSCPTETFNWCLIGRHAANLIQTYELIQLASNFRSEQQPHAAGKLQN
jgi:hypothetical protein